jgi:hypothetical protein
MYVIKRLLLTPETENLKKYKIRIKVTKFKKKIICSGNLVCDNNRILIQIIFLAFKNRYAYHRVGNYVLGKVHDVLVVGSREEHNLAVWRQALVDPDRLVLQLFSK